MNKITVIFLCVFIISIPKLCNASTKTQTYRISDLKIFSLKKRLAENVVDTVSQFLSERGKISVDEPTNSVIVNDAKENIDVIERIIKQIDTAVSTKQIMVEAVIIETNTDNNKDLGISWELQKELRPSEPKNVQSSFSSDLPFSLNNGARINIGTLNTDNFNILLQYLKSKDDTNILSSPRITIMDNEHARIMVGNKIPYVKSVTAENIVNKDVSFLDVGVKLDVTAKILPDDRIKLRLHPEVSSFVSWSPADNQPIVEIREAETAVVIKDNTTIVIGGLMREKLVRNTQKIPGVSDIPVIGKIFKKTHKQKTNVELLIFISPKLVSTQNTDEPSELSSLVKMKKRLSDVKE